MLLLKMKSGADLWAVWAVGETDETAETALAEWMSAA